MRIIIIGAGELGFHLARFLSQEKHDIVIIDVDEENLRRVADNLDVLTLHGSGTSYGTLEEAGTSRADMLIAVTSSEEVNFTACMVAGKLGSMKKIMRIRNPEFMSGMGPVGADAFGIDMVIYPEGAAAQEIVRLIRRAAATEVVDLADGRIQLLGLKLDDNSPLIGKRLEDIPQPDGIAYRAVCISRGMQTVIPKRDMTFRKADQIFVISKTEAVPAMLEVVGKGKVNYHKIMILGGDEIGHQVALELEKDMSVKLLESSRERSYKIAEKLTRTLVLHNEGRDLDLLAKEGILHMDAYVAVTPDDEHNIISCLMAKHLGVKKTIARIEKADYVPFSNAIGIDGLVNKKLSAATAVLKFIRQAEVLTAATLHGVGAEVLELMAREGCKATQKSVGQLDFPEGAIIGCVMHEGGVTIPVSATTIRAGDRVVVFTLPKAISAVERFFR